MSLKPYKTLLRDAQEEFVVNKSRFIGHGRPCGTEEEALAFLSEKRAKYKDATHNCYAYIIGPNMGVMRYSDDGEPGGTAGMPIIEVMKARGIVFSNFRDLEILFKSANCTKKEASHMECLPDQSLFVSQISFRL